MTTAFIRTGAEMGVRITLDTGPGVSVSIGFQVQDVYAWMSVI